MRIGHTLFSLLGLLIGLSLFLFIQVLVLIGVFGLVGVTGAVVLVAEVETAYKEALEINHYLYREN